MQYGFKTYKTKVEQHEFWAVESTELKGCVAQGEALDEALAEFKINEQEWLETAKEVGIPIPKQCIQKINDYSGKLSLRIPKTIHRELTEVAQKEGVSTNALINSYIAKGIGNWMGEKKVVNLTVKIESSKQQIHSDITNSMWLNGVQPIRFDRSAYGGKC